MREIYTPGEFSVSVSIGVKLRRISRQMTLNQLFSRQMFEAMELVFGPSFDTLLTSVLGFPLRSSASAIVGHSRLPKPN
jgi:hypothetical protein